VIVFSREPRSGAIWAAAARMRRCSAMSFLV
jgi:hypothetical protein